MTLMTKTVERIMKRSLIYSPWQQQPVSGWKLVSQSKLHEVQLRSILLLLSVALKLKLSRSVIRSASSFFFPV